MIGDGGRVRRGWVVEEVLLVILGRGVLSLGREVGIDTRGYFLLILCYFEVLERFCLVLFRFFLKRRNRRCF